MPAGARCTLQSHGAGPCHRTGHALAASNNPCLLNTWDHHLQGYQRRATILVYLNDVKEGGSTRFEHLGPLAVQPKQGSALLFFPAFNGGMPDAR